MKYVLDASVSIRWVIPAHLSNKARQLRADYKNRVHELIAPEVWVGENANALIKAERQKALFPGQSIIHMTDLLISQPVLHLFRPLVFKAMSIASQMHAGLHDCLYVVLAEREQCELVTADDKLIRNLQAQFPFIKHLSSLP